MPSQGCAPTAGFLLLGLLAAQSHGIIQVTALAHGVLGWFLRNACVACLEQSLCPSSSPASLEADHFCWWDQNDPPNALWFSCCNSGSLLHILSLVEMAQSCFSALLLPFPYLKVVIFSHQIFSKFKQTQFLSW